MLCRITPESFWLKVARPLVRRIGDPDWMRVTEASCQPSSALRDHTGYRVAEEVMPRANGQFVDPVHLHRLANVERRGLICRSPRCAASCSCPPMPWLCSLEIEWLHT